jgi:hypothetical protein
MNGDAQILDGKWEEMDPEDQALWLAFALAYPDLSRCWPPMLPVPPQPAPPVVTGLYEFWSASTAAAMYMVTPWGRVDRDHYPLVGAWGTVEIWFTGGYDGWALIHGLVVWGGNYSDWQVWDYRYNKPTSVVVQNRSWPAKAISFRGVVLQSGQGTTFWSDADPPPMWVLPG